MVAVSESVEVAKAVTLAVGVIEIVTKTVAIGVYN
jgi:hypothetical protein